MKNLIIVVGLCLGLVACEHAGGVIQDARTALHAFCTLKRTTLAQLLLTPAQIQAAEVLCSAIGDPVGVP